MEKKFNTIEDNNISSKDKLKAFDYVRVGLLFSIVIAFAVLWYMSKQLYELSDTFLILTSLLFVLFIVEFILEIVNLHKKKVQWIKYVYMIALMLFVFSLILYRLDFMCVLINTKQAEKDYLIAISGDVTEEAKQIAKEIYIKNRENPLKEADKKFYLSMLISAGVCGGAALLSWIINYIIGIKKIGEKNGNKNI